MVRAAPRARFVAVAVADIVGFIGLDFTRMIKLAIPEDLKNVHRWAQAMRERPAAKAAM